MLPLSPVQGFRKAMPRSKCRKSIYTVRLFETLPLQLLRLPANCIGQTNARRSRLPPNFWACPHRSAQVSWHFHYIYIRQIFWQNGSYRVGRNTKGEARAKVGFIAFTADPIFSLMVELGTPGSTGALSIHRQSSS